MSKQIDLRALLESKVGNIEPTEASKIAIERAEMNVPHNLMFDAESTEFKPETKPVTTTGAKSLTVEQAKEFNAEMDRFINECLISGTDYGVIPNCRKPTLLKSGAEKVAIYLGLIFRTEVVGRTEDFAQGFFAYECKVYLIDVDGIVRGEGIATANTKESKYIKSNGFSVQNVVLKMCKKRALVDAVLNVAGLSAYFTQDIEDMDLPQEQVGRNPDELKQGAKTKASSSKPATKKQMTFLEKLMQEAGSSPEALNRYVKQNYDVEDYHNASALMVSELIEKFQNAKQQ